MLCHGNFKIQNPASGVDRPLPNGQVTFLGTRSKAPFGRGGERGRPVVCENNESHSLGKWVEGGKINSHPSDVGEGS
jgi:hypothetical protein